MQINHQEKLSLLTELIKLARVDYDLREMEHQFLEAISIQLQIDKEDFEALFTQYIDFIPPKDEFNRILQFQRLILLSNVDLEQNEKELNFIRDSGIKMGLNLFAVEEILTTMLQYENKMLPPDVLISIFSKHYN